MVEGDRDVRPRAPPGSRSRSRASGGAIDPSMWLRNVTPSSSMTRSVGERDDLEAAAVGEDRAVPAHEPVEPAEALDPLVARAAGRGGRCWRGRSRRRPSSRSSGSRALTVAFVPTGMNWGVSTTPWGSSRRPRRARVAVAGRAATVTSTVKRIGRGSGAGRIEGEPAAGTTAAAAPASPATAGSAIAGSGIVRPEARHVGLAAARRRDLVAEAGQVGAGEVGRDPALRRPVEEPEPEQERLVDVLDRLDLLGSGRRPARRRRPARTPNFWMIAARSLRSVESRPSSSISRRRIASSAAGSVTRPSPWTSAWSRTRFRSRLTIRGVPRPRLAMATAAAGVDLDAEDPGRALDDLGQLGRRVEVEAVGGPEAVAERASRCGPRASSRRRR